MLAFPALISVLFFCILGIPIARVRKNRLRYGFLFFGLGAQFGVGLAFFAAGILLPETPMTGLYFLGISALLGGLLSGLGTLRCFP